VLEQPWQWSARCSKRLHQPYEAFQSHDSEAASTSRIIYTLATEIFATEEDLAYVLDDSSQSGDDASRWDITATRIVEVCVLWRI
jgi:hypothetical protein